MLSIIGLDPTSAAQNNIETAKWTLGALYTTNGRDIYRFIRAEDADLVAGDCVYWASADGEEVTRDVSGGGRLGDKAAGIAIVAITDGNYGFIQVAGVGQVAIALNSGDFTAGNPIMGDTSYDGKVAAGTVGTDDGKHIGTALAASTSSSLAAGAYVLTGNI